MIEAIGRIVTGANRGTGRTIRTEVDVAQPKLEFWFEFASTYSYLSAMRIGPLAANMGVEVVWRPFLLGPIFKANGWSTSPFNLQPAKGRYMVRDIERIAAERGLLFALPEPFPAASLTAARVACGSQDEDWIEEFVKAVYLAEFEGRRDIASPEVLHDALAAAGAPVEEAMARAASDEVKSQLRAQTEEAARRDIFGAPTFITQSGELFWGDDRLEQALAWAGGGS
ncbi:MAG: 2-hydroxychromene-2-carboxylate isomerase [Rhizobiales bacterium]|nr:2-hydroxychromene-2-carboxylate isomerase [Hyphomicrobiales bacterium]